MISYVRRYVIRGRISQSHLRSNGTIPSFRQGVPPNLTVLHGGGRAHCRLYAGTVEALGRQARSRR